MSKVISMRRPGEPQPEPEQTGKVQGGRPGLPVTPAVEEYLQAAKRRLDPQTFHEYQHMLRVFATWCDAQHVGLDYINRRSVDQFCEHLSTTHLNTHHNGPLTRRTQGNYVRVIKAFLYSTARDSIIYKEYLSLETIHWIKAPTCAETLIVPFSDADIKELLKAAQVERTEELRVRNTTLIFLLSNTGIRVKELARLKVGDIALEPGMGSVKVFGKRQKERIVCFGELTRRKLERYLEVCRKGAAKDSPLFVSYAMHARGSRALTPSGVQQLLEALGKRTTIEGVRISPHTFRHYYATKFLRDGGSVVDLKLCLGHTRLEMTERYIRSLASTDSDFRERIAGLLR